MSKDLSVKPLVISLCGTYLKPEMQSIYRQVSGLQAVRTKVYTQVIENRGLFPFDDIEVLQKIARPRLKGNFILRFWYKYVVKQWPPPIEINRLVKPYYPYDLVDHLQADQPDLVHIYYGHKAVHFYDMIRAWGGPFVVSFHGVDVAKFIDRPGYLEKLREVFRDAQLVMGRSHSLLERLLELGCPEEKLRLNRTPIPLDHLQARIRTQPENGEWRLVQACRLISKKGILTTLDALVQIKPLFPKLKYILCGEGAMKDKILAKAASLDLLDNLELRGWLSQAQLQEEYAKAHLFLHPSETTEESDQEGIPNSMLEAMAVGLPVIATHHGGIPEAVTHGVEGLLAEERQAYQLAHHLQTVMTDEALLQKLSQQAAESVRANFGAKAQIGALEEVYLEAIERNKLAVTI